MSFQRSESSAHHVAIPSPRAPRDESASGMRASRGSKAGIHATLVGWRRVTASLQARPRQITLVAARAPGVAAPGVRVARGQVQPADVEEAHERVERGGGPRYAAPVTRREQRAPQRPQALQTLWSPLLATRDGRG